MSLESLKLEAEHALDDLWSENLIPFKLSAQKVESIGANEYIVRFYDSRLHSIDVSLSEGESFEDHFKSAVLGRVSRMSGRLKTRVR